LFVFQFASGQAVVDPFDPDTIDIHISPTTKDDKVLLRTHRALELPWSAKTFAGELERASK
jgi:hypothetical protein